jgi:hypothetical protein
MQSLIGRHDMKWAQTPLCRPESPETMTRGAIRLRHGIAQAIVETEGMEVVHQTDGECVLTATAGATVLLRAPQVQSPALQVQSPVFAPVAHAFHPT